MQIPIYQSDHLDDPQTHVTQLQNLEHDPAVDSCYDSDQDQYLVGIVGLSSLQVRYGGVERVSGCVFLKDTVSYITDRQYIGLSVRIHSSISVCTIGTRLTHNVLSLWCLA
jgi:hypothetical protein